MLREESKHDRGHRVQWASTSQAPYNIDRARRRRPFVQDRNATCRQAADDQLLYLAQTGIVKKRGSCTSPSRLSVPQYTRRAPHLSLRLKRGKDPDKSK